MNKTLKVGIVLPLAALLIMASAFLMTHHRVYSTNCHQTPDGRACALVGWEGNK